MVRELVRASVSAALKMNHGTAIVGASSRQSRADNAPSLKKPQLLAARKFNEAPSL